MDRTPVQMTAAAPHLDTVEMAAPVIPAAPRPQLVTEPPKPSAPEHSGPTFQGNLFGPRVAATPRPADPAVAAPPAKKQRTTSNNKGRDVSRQQRLHLQEPAVPKVVLSNMLECDDAVAVPSHRAMACAVDMVVVAVAFGVFLLTFKAAGADIALSKATTPYYLGSAVLITIFYRALFCIANLDTPGMSWTGLRLVRCDGRPPNVRNRMLRLLGGFVGFIAAGIGLLWSIVDADQFTWHDHMSKTFPTPRFE